MIRQKEPKSSETKSNQECSYTTSAGILEAPELKLDPKVQHFAPNQKPTCILANKVCLSF